MLDRQHVFAAEQRAHVREQRGALVRSIAASELVVEYSSSRSWGPTAIASSSRSYRSGSNGDSAKESSQGALRCEAKRSHGPRRRSSAASGSGGCVSHQCVQINANPPRGRSTRAILAIARGGRTSGTPRRRRPRRRSRPRAGCPRRAGEHVAVLDERAHRVVRLDGDDVAERRASSCVSRPVPAARSSTRASAPSSSSAWARSSNVREYGGLTRWYVSATLPKLSRMSGSSTSARSAAERRNRPAAASHELGEDLVAVVPHRDPATLAASASTSSRGLTCSCSATSSCFSPNGKRFRTSSSGGSGRPASCSVLQPRVVVGGNGGRAVRGVPEQGEDTAGRTRARSRRPPCVGDPVDASPAKTASTDASSSRISSAAPARTSASGTRVSRSSRSSSSGSTAITRAYRATSTCVSLPVPAPRSSTVASRSSGNLSSTAAG